ncbi:hypothetical protein H5394_15240 [Paracoccus sp. MC1862]|nr:hypothetical protein [Paracoccus sp. MC1862]QQO45113.1 hypothetical protein JGR78_01535 [Paracoccus sp. MC1862]
MSAGLDRIEGGSGDDTLHGDGMIYGGETASLAGGNDRILGGDGDDVIYGDGTVRSGNPDYPWGAAELIGGDDRIIGGRGDDILWGDGEATAGREVVLTRGADTFVFRANGGRDQIMDFRSEDVDAIQFAMPKLKWSDLDTNRNGRLDDADRFISLQEGGTRIDYGAASRSSHQGEDVVTVVDVTDLAASSFLFV